jgi:hypothetical protein
LLMGRQTLRNGFAEIAADDLDGRGQFDRAQ